MDTGGDAFLKQVVDVYLSFGSNWLSARLTLLDPVCKTTAPRLSVPNEVASCLVCTASSVRHKDHKLICGLLYTAETSINFCAADSPKSLLQETCPVIPDLTRLGLPWNVSWLRSQTFDASNFGLFAIWYQEIAWWVNVGHHFPLFSHILPMNNEWMTAHTHTYIYIYNMYNWY